MKIFHDFDRCDSIKNAVVTTGSFDGVHSAHKVILKRLRKLAEETDGETVLITFHPHPRKVLYPDTFGKDFYLINSDREKIELLEEAGLDNLIIVEFTLEFSRISSVDFVKNILLNRLHAKKIVIGYNHHFGHNREGDHEKLRQLGEEWGFDVEEIPEQDIQHEAVSSAAIRQALLDGNIEKANAYMENHYLIMGPAGIEDPGLRSKDIPSRNVMIEEESKLIPPTGFYDARVTASDKTCPAMCFIQKADGDARLSGVYIKLYGGTTVNNGDIVKIAFNKLIRKENS